MGADPRMISDKTLSAALSALLFAPWLTGCAGGSQAQVQGEAAAPERAASEQTSPDEASETSSIPPRAGESCEETGCFSCGEGTCPRGSYCDESNAERSACAWLGDCGSVPDCTCLTRILGPSCSCEDGAGTPRIRCSK